MRYEALNAILLLQAYYFTIDYKSLRSLLIVLVQGLPPPVGRLIKRDQRTNKP